MIDNEKVIKGLEYCIADDFCDGCPYECNCFADDAVAYVPLMRDALSLLNEQKAKIKSLERTIEDICCGG